MGQAAAGGLEATVKSEKGKGQYVVNIGENADGKARAKCTCVDFKTRGGLCKHGAAALLALNRAAGGAEALTPTKSAGPDSEGACFRTTPAGAARRASGGRAARPPSPK